MIILSFDPGTETTGYGVLELDEKSRVFHKGHGTICTKKKKGATPENRIVKLREGVLSLIHRFSPDVIAAEDVFVGVNRASSITLAHFRGVIIEACASAEHKVYSYHPTTVKKVVTGYGRAKKPDMQAAVQKTLRLTTLPTPDDAADALGVGITYLQQELNLDI